ncbi:DUF1499 domain-containing protein [Gimesia panareensis]|uniref:DUF1499 domain-containing protein n=1 Tax=Gimesia panareensis TaxID=2527978 RepID=UPI001188A6BC|nr:DUF1499 domain-containing protein [Gimesia panareensis]QDU48493.1 hypothetical protein Pan110_08080 [Gimesia panareensis]
MILFWCVSLFVVFWIGIVIVNSLTSPPDNLGVTEGKLSPCPASPNCVCSTDPSVSHQIAPLAFTDSSEQAHQRLVTILEQYPGCQIVQSEEHYLRAEFRTRWLRFADDVEFLIEPRQNVIQVRSASRVGYSDLGTNRKRIEAIRQKFAQGTP